MPADTGVQGSDKARDPKRAQHPPLAPGSTSSSVGNGSQRTDLRGGRGCSAVEFLGRLSRRKQEQEIALCFWEQCSFYPFTLVFPK